MIYQSSYILCAPSLTLQACWELRQTSLRVSLSGRQGRREPRESIPSSSVSASLRDSFFSAGDAHHLQRC
jgi:hypothetical protein